MRSPADILYNFLLTKAFADPESGGLFIDPETGGVYTDPETGGILAPVFVSFLPDTPDEIMGIFDTAGRPDGRLMRTGERIEHHGIQIQIRGKDYTAAYAQARQVALTLDAVNKVTVAVASDEVYILHNVSRSGTIIPVGIETVEDRRRHLFTINMTVTLSQVLTTLTLSRKVNTKEKHYASKRKIR